MIKYYCDICGEEIFDSEDICHLRLTKGTIYCSDISTNKDICEKCYTKIEDIIKKKVKD